VQIYKCFFKQRNLYYLCKNALLMQICTLVLNASGSPENFNIVTADNIVKFEFIVSAGSSATMQGNQEVSGQSSVAQTFGAGDIYNSPFSSGASTWNGVTIVATAGTVKLNLYRT
jgi:hypothetical protein